MPTLFDPALIKTRREDKNFLEKTAIPIVTVSATYTEDLKRLHDLPNNNTSTDIVFSRAHFSMALGVATAAWGKKIDEAKAWIVDPTNYVTRKDWFSVRLTEEIGQTIARYPLLKFIKDFIDKFGRQKMPILDSITPPLLFLTQHVDKPILSFHIAAGNILAEQGKSVLQVITDPHVRDEYVLHSEKKNVKFCVFDENTKLEFFEKAALHNKNPDPQKVIVTGPPIDPRIIAARDKKYAWRSGPLRLCLSTGGLGTNKTELHTLLEQLLPELRKRDNRFQLVIYAGTHDDISDMVRKEAAEARVAIGAVDDKKAKLRLLYHPQIIDANELLITHAFPWAHGFLTKPSGDMAYDAVASGSFILTLAEWGPWEENIREIFEQKGIARKAITKDIVAQLEVLMAAHGKPHSWIERAMLNATNIEKIYLNGAENILRAYKKFS